MAFHGQQYTLPVYGYHAWWRRADLTATYAYHRRVVQLLQSRAPAGSLAVQGAAPQVPPRGDRRGLSRRALRDDAPRSGQVGAVVGEHRVDHLPDRRTASATCTGSAGRCRTTSAWAWSTPSPHGRASARTASSTSTTASWSPTRWAPCGASTTSSASSSTPTVAQTIADWQDANRSGASGTHRYTAEQFGLSDAALRSDYDFYIRPLRRRDRRNSMTGPSPSTLPDLGRPDARRSSASSTTCSRPGAPTARPRPRSRT